MKRWIALLMTMVMLCLTMPVVWGESLSDGLLTYRVESGQATVCGFLNDRTTTVTIPATVQGYPVVAVAQHAFQDCSELTSVTLPDGLTTIGDYAFADCSALTSITLPDSLTTIGAYTFDWCDALTSVTLPDGLTTIGNYAFAECSALTTLTVPATVTSIGAHAFDEHMTLRGLEGSAIQTYAEEWGLPFQMITEEQMKQEVLAGLPIDAPSTEHPTQQSADKNDNQSDGFPWLWVGIGGGGSVIVALVVFMLVLHNKKRNK